MKTTMLVAAMTLVAATACSTADVAAPRTKSLSAPTAVANGFDVYGYNDVAGIFNGTGSSWCQAGGQPTNCMGSYSGDKLIMKWNKAWTTCNAAQGTPAENTAAACAGAWTDNEWNGTSIGGSGTVWHYKIVWSANCLNNIPLTDGGYCIWGSYEVVMDQGVDLNASPAHQWFTNAKASGYGVSS